MTRQANALLVIIVTFLLAYLTRWGYTALPEHYLVALLVAIAVASVVLPATGAFRREFEWAVLRRLRRLMAGWVIVLLILMSLAAISKTSDQYSRIWFGLWGVYCAVGLTLILLLSSSVDAKPLVVAGYAAAVYRDGGALTPLTILLSGGDPGDVLAAMGFLEVVAGPLVRSSYRADRVFEKNNVGL